MKPIFSFILLMFSFCLNAQDKMEAELLMSVDTVQAPNVKIRSCGGSIYKNATLFIIDGVPYTSDENRSFLEIFSPDNIVSVSILNGHEATAIYGSAANDGAVIINTKKYLEPNVSKKNFPFKVYEIGNTNWIIHQDMYNAISAKVPGLTIKNASNTSTPEIRMRGDANTIVIVDGIQYDASILNTLNPSDIESVKVSNSPAARNYFINN